MAKNTQPKLPGRVWTALRFVLGAIMLWAFFDKVFALGFATEAGKGWLDGVSPTTGFLKFGTSGMFKPLFESLAGNVVVDWLFMLGLFGIGTSLILGIGTRIAGYSGALLMMLLYAAVIPPEHHPVFDEHIVYGLVFYGFTMRNIGYRWGLREWWSKTDLVKQYPILE